MSEVKHLSTKGEIIELLEDLIARGQRGEKVSAAFRLRLADGTYEDVVLGFGSEAEGDEALASLYRAMGHLN